MQYTERYIFSVFIVTGTQASLADVVLLIPKSPDEQLVSEATPVPALRSNMHTKEVGRFITSGFTRPKQDLCTYSAPGPSTGLGPELCGQWAGTPNFSDWRM